LGKEGSLSSLVLGDFVEGVLLTSFATTISTTSLGDVYLHVLVRINVHVEDGWKKKGGNGIKRLTISLNLGA